MAVVEGPNVENGKVVSWNATFSHREFALDMAGFAINLDLVLNSNASFNEQCIGTFPENCYLLQYGLKKEDVTPFGWNDSPRDILVWHTRSEHFNRRGDNKNYTAEL